MHTLAVFALGHALVTGCSINLLLHTARALCTATAALAQLPQQQQQQHQHQHQHYSSSTMISAVAAHTATMSAAILALSFLMLWHRREAALCSVREQNMSKRAEASHTLLPIGASLLRLILLFDVQRLLCLGVHNHSV
jgi:hypothetical protein